MSVGKKGRSSRLSLKLGKQKCQEGRNGDDDIFGHDGTRSEVSLLFGGGRDTDKEVYSIKDGILEGSGQLGKIDVTSESSNESGEGQAQNKLLIR